VAEAKSFDTRDRRAVPQHQPRRNGASTRDAHLLADDCAHPQFICIPRTRHAQSGTRSNERTEHRVDGEMAVGCVEIGVEVEDVARLLCDVSNALTVSGVRAHRQPAVATRRNLQDARITVNSDRAPICRR